MERHSPTLNVILATLVAAAIFATPPLAAAARVIVEESQLQQAQTALSESLATAKSTCDIVSKLSTSGGLRPREAAAVKDCMETLATSVDELQSSMKAMRSISGGNGSGRRDLRFKMSNVQTWVSAALTNEDSCMDGFQGVNSGVKTTIRGHIVKVANMTRNALALINGLA